MKNHYRKNEIGCLKVFISSRRSQRVQTIVYQQSILFDIVNNLCVGLSSLDSHIKSEFESKVQIFRSFHKIYLLGKMLQFLCDNNASQNKSWWTLNFSSHICPKMDLALETEESNVGIRMSILEKLCAAIFSQNGQFWLFRPKFAQK